MSDKQMPDQNIETTSPETRVAERATTPDDADVSGHGLVQDGFHRPTTTSRNAEHDSQRGSRGSGRTHPTKRGRR